MTGPSKPIDPAAPSIAGSIDEVLRQHADRRPDAPFLDCAGVGYTYGAIDRRADELARGLAILGVRPGDRVAIICPNRPEMLELYFGCARLGAIQVPLNVFLRGDFLRHQLLDCSASVLVTDLSGWRAAQPLLGELAALRTVITLDQDAHEVTDTQVSLADYASVVSMGATGAVPVAETPRADDIAAVLYTSGTTGASKGCVLSNGYHVRAGSLGARMLGLDEREHLVTALPLFHGGARLLAVAAALVSGAKLSVLPEFRAGTFLTEVDRRSGTVAVGVGAMATALLAREPNGADRAHTLRRAVWAALPSGPQAAFESRFGVRVHNGGFGQTECVPVTIAPPDGYKDRRTLGAAAPDLELAVVDDDDRPVPAGQVGEIVIRPQHRHAMFDGYWANPAATVVAWRGLWHHTGDFGRLDTDGLLYFVDRKKDSMRRRGENVSSVEVEAAIARHPAISEVAVHAVASELSEDDIKACLVLVDGAEPTPAELFDFFTRELPYYAVPRYVEVLPELPVNAVRRVLKYELRERGVTESTWDLESMGFSVDRDARRP